MLPEPLPGRRFTEAETDAILRRTAELASGTDEGSASRGLTVDEMSALAAEAGLDPALVHRAAREVTLRDAQQVTPWRGGPRRLLAERVISREISEEDWEAMVGEIQGTLGSLGFVSRLGRTRTWMVAGARGPATQRQISVVTTVQQGRTVIRIEEQLDRLAGSLFGGLIGGLGGGLTGLWIGIGMGVFHSPAAAGALVCTGLAGSWWLARTLFARSAARRSAALEELLARLAAVGEAPSDPPSQ